MSEWKQLLRFGIVGVVSNALLYVFYFALTWAGLGYAVAVTLLYVVGVAQTFVFNKRWSFGHAGGVTRSLAKYLAVYGACYLLNLALLTACVEYFGYSHAIVQAAAILPFALLVFFLQKYWVFAPDKPTTGPNHGT